MAKSLYARALRCAHSECTEPLYYEDEKSGNWTLNSRICHINARSENGPRWKPDQTSDENRHEANLLLLCTRHASAIDDPRNVPNYPEATLLDWKKKQIDAHKAAVAGGWPLTEKMAEAVIQTSFPDFALSFNNSNIILGGEGGRAPGSGGGGGGAIGPGSRGGKGGKGGDITNLSDDPDLVAKMLSFALDTAGPPPGSGGAGAGAIGPSSIGGDGGNGGDILAGEIELEIGDTIEIEVGAGGNAAQFPGQHGSDGSDSLLVHKSADGEVKRVLRAAGGKGATVGQLPSDWQTITKDDLENGFQISTLLLASAIEVRDGLAYILGGGWSKFTVPTLPFQTSWGCLLIANWIELERSNTRGLQIHLANPSGIEVSCTPLELPSTTEKLDSFKWLVNLPVYLDQQGRWRITATSGELCLAEIACDVHLLNS